MTLIDDVLKGAVGGSDLSTALTQPLAQVKAAMDSTVKAAEEWRAALAAFEKVLAEYGVKVTL